MHELSIAQSIVDLIVQYVPDEKSSLVQSVKVKVGSQSGVVADSLEFCFTAITKETRFDGTRLDIESVPFVVWCDDCSSSFQNDDGTILCPLCGGGKTRVVSGTELQVVELELMDEPREVT